MGFETNPPRLSGMRIADKKAQTKARVFMGLIL
jgi:hypothetical protein